MQKYKPEKIPLVKNFMVMDRKLIFVSCKQLEVKTTGDKESFKSKHSVGRISVK